MVPKMLIIQLLLLFVLANARPTTQEVKKPVKFVDFRGPFLSDSAEKKLLYSKVERVWLIEDYWNIDGIRGICTNVIHKKDTSALRWFLSTGLQNERRIIESDKVNHSFGLIFEALLSLEDLNQISKLFPMAKKLMKKYGVDKKDVVLRSDKKKERYDALIDLDDFTMPFPESFPLDLKRQATPDEAKEANEAFHKLITSGGFIHARRWEQSQDMKTIALYPDNKAMIEELMRTYTYRELMKMADDQVITPQASMFAGLSDDSIEYEEIQLQHRINWNARSDGYITTNSLHEKFIKTFPPPGHRKHSHMARMVADLVCGYTKEKRWSMSHLNLLLEVGLLHEFMRDDSDYQILEVGLSGPVWEVIEPKLDKEYYLGTRGLVLAQNLPLLNVAYDLLKSLSAAGIEFVANLFEKPIYSRSRDVVKRRAEKLLGLLRKVSNKEKALLSEYWFQNPNIGRQAFDDLLIVESLALFNLGGAKVTFDEYSRSSLALDSKSVPSEERVKELIAEKVALVGRTEKSPLALQRLEVNFVHGRTAYLNEPGKAIKLEKKGKYELAEEMIMDNLLQKNHQDLQLTSRLPENPVLYPRVSLSQELVELLVPEGADYSLSESFFGWYTGLKFDAPVGYEIHLHKVKDLQELIASSKKALGDAAILANKFGLVSVAPADLFHNREDNRRYKWNADIEHVDVIGRGRLGAGRLDQWRKAIQYVNMGQSGLRDLKHLQFIDEIKETTLDSRVGTMLTHLGNFLLSWVLSVGEWFLNNGFKLQDLQRVLSEGFATFLAKFTGKPMEQCSEFANVALRLDRLALQMKYFMTLEYVEDNKKNPNNWQLDDELFGKLADISAAQPDNYWNEQKGWMRHEGSEDLGPYNGPFPITELIRTLHLVTTTALNVPSMNPS
eukprot:Partr_v1_DN27656_c2_g1_i4_m64866